MIGWDYRAKVTLNGVVKNKTLSYRPWMPNLETKYAIIPLQTYPFAPWPSVKEFIPVVESRVMSLTCQ